MSADGINDEPARQAAGSGETNTDAGTDILNRLVGDSNIEALSARERRVALLQPLVDRMWRGRCAKKVASGGSIWLPADQPFDACKLSEHCAGVSAYGLAPITPGESVTRVALIDFDDHDAVMNPKEVRVTVEDVASSLREDGYEPHVFRSSGGNGYHVILLWDQPQDARSVRAMLNDALIGFGIKNGAGGLKQLEAEVFPKADAVALDGCGNQFILPFAGKSAPLDPGFEWRVSPDVPHVEPPAPRERTVSDTPEMSRVKSALDAIPNSGETQLAYDEWFRIVCAVHHATGGSDEGLALMHELSARSSKYDADFLDHRVWGYVDDERGGAVITAGTLFRMAAAYGWLDPTIADDFDVIEPATTPGRIQTREFRLLSIAEVMESVGPVDYVIDQWLELNVMGTLVGDPGAYKTFLAVDWALSIAAGRAWHGNAVKAGAVVYVAGEGHNGFGRRLGAWGVHHGVDLKGLPFCKSSRSVPLLDKKAAELLEREAKAFADACGRPLRLVVVDTFARNFGDGDENAARDVGRFVDHVDRHLREPTGAAVVVVHHTGLAAKDRGRGSSALKGATDFEYLVEKPEPLACLLTANRMKDAALPAPRQFRALSVPLDMDDASSLVLEHTGVTAPPRRKAVKVGANERLVMRVFQDLTGLAGEAPTPNELANAAKEQMGHVDGARDRRREMAMKAVNSVIDGGMWELVDGRVHVVVGAAE